MWVVELNFLGCRIRRWVDNVGTCWRRIPGRSRPARCPWAPRPSPEPPVTTRVRGATRTTMLVAAADLLRERGAAGVTVDAVLARSGAPARVGVPPLPRGQAKSCVRLCNSPATDHRGRARRRRRRCVSCAWTWRAALIDSDFTAGSPVLAAAVGSGPDEQQLTSVAGDIFRRWRNPPGAFCARADGATAPTTISALEVRSCCAGPPTAPSRSTTWPGRSSS